MKQVIVCVVDVKAKAFMPPFAVQHASQAVRSFAEEVNRKAEGNMIAAYPEDFELHKIGVFDQETGELHPEPELLARAVNLVKE